MIISDKHRFALVHIPKCAGSTLRHALAPFDDAAERFHDRSVANHPDLGPLDYHHIPLAVLAKYFSEDFARLAEYRSYALVRDPFSRFPSSLHERLVQRDRLALNERDSTEVAKEIDGIMEQLSRLPINDPIIAPELIHFSRQTDYIFLEGQQIVQTVRPVDAIKEVLRELSEIVGQTIRLEDNKNQRMYHAFPAVKKWQLAITRPIEKALPRKVWKPAFQPIKAAFVKAGLIRHAGNPLEKLPNAREIQAFVTEFYAKDIRMFEEISANRPTSGKLKRLPN